MVNLLAGIGRILMTIDARLENIELLLSENDGSEADA